MADENTNKDQNKKQGQYGTGSQGTQEREQDITGSSGVQNKQGKAIDQGSTTGQKGGAGMGQQDQRNFGGQQQGQRNVGGQQQGQGQQRPGSPGMGAAQNKPADDSAESEDE